MSDQRKIAYFLPNTFTAINMACGFGAIVLASKGDFYKACMFIVLGALFDSVDGRVARLTGTQSQFGEEFDSLSDAISFGAAPALIFYFKFFTGIGRPGMVVAFLYLLCTVLRLARFNANIDKVKANYFQGLPSPGAAIAMLGYVLLSLELPELNIPIVAAVYSLFYSVMMISNIPFPSFKDSPWVKNHKKQALFVIFLVLASLFVYEEIMLPLWISFYVLASFFYFLRHRKEFEDVFDWKEEQSNPAI